MFSPHYLLKYNFSSQMSSCELAESGVIGLENGLASLPSEQDIDPPIHESESEVRAPPLQLDDCQSLVDSDVEGAESSRNVLQLELQGLHDIEERILEENMKIHELRRHERVEELVEKPQDGAQLHRSNADRERFLKELEKEKREVERMERSLHKEMEKDKHKVKKRLSRTRRVVTCSIIDRDSKQETMDAGDLCEKTTTNSQGQDQNQDPGIVVDSLNTDGSVLCSPSCPQNSFPSDPLDTYEDKMDPVEVGETNFSEGKHLISSYCSGHADGGEAESVTDGPGQDPHDCDSSRESVKGQGSELRDITEVGKDFELGDFTAFRKDSDLGDVIEVEEDSELRDFADHGHESRVVDEVDGRESEVCLAPDLPPDLGAFDPGGSTESVPVPKPRKSLCVEYASELSKSQEQIDADTDKAQGPHPSETTPILTPPQPKARTCQLFTNHSIHPDVMKHSSNNNNNNHPSGDEMTVSCSNTEPSCVQANSSDLVSELENHPTEHSDVSQAISEVEPSCGEANVQVNPSNGLVLDLECHPTEHSDVSGPISEVEHIDDQASCNPLENVTNENGAFQSYSLSVCSIRSSPVSHLIDIHSREVCEHVIEHGVCGCMLLITLL